MKNIKKIALLIACSASQMLFAQEKSNNGNNPLSLRPINDSNVMYKTTLWRRIDLHEKQNSPFFSKGSEITKHLIDGVKAGLLTPYADDTLARVLTKEQFIERLTRKFEGGGLSQEEKEAGFSTKEDDGWGGGGSATTTANSDTGFGEAKPAATTAVSGGYEMFPNELALVELKEDWVFDKQRSRQYFDIQSLTIMIPAETTAEGLEKPLCAFKYKELDNYFRLNTKCIWYNAENIAQHKNLADAFELRLFHGKIIKKSNAGDKYLDDIYKSPREGMLKSQQLEYELMEFEHNLWEY